MNDNEKTTTVTQNVTLCLIKPDAVEGGHVGHVMSRIEVEGFRVLAAKWGTLTYANLLALYYAHRDRDFFPAMSSFMTSGPSLALVLEREDAVAHWRRVLGPTDPREAGSGLRALYGNKEGVVFKNVAHGSDSPEAVLREINLFFRVDDAGDLVARELGDVDVLLADGPMSYRAWRAAAIGFVARLGERRGRALGSVEIGHPLVSGLRYLGDHLVEIHCWDPRDYPNGMSFPLSGNNWPKNTTTSALNMEVARARTKFPGNRYLIAALAEELGELAEAHARGDADAVFVEAIQCACVALRVAEEGDAAVYANRGLLDLVTAVGYTARALLQRASEAAVSTHLHRTWLAVNALIDARGDSTFDDVTDAESKA